MSKRLLVIDDEADLRRVIQIALEELEDWQIVLAASGQEGLQTVRTGQWDAILLDISMPNMDGFTVFEQLQADDKTQSIPVVLLTAKVLPHDRARFAEMNIAGVMTKPFDPITLGDQITQLLRWEKSGS
jgi:CheY-like chemotaxis protein